jgi:GNAT superfamily N-acetyltransferase
VLGEPVVTALIQDRDLAVWPDDGRALVVHKLSVRRAYAGRGYPLRLLEFAAQHARRLGKTFLRLDTVAGRPKLRKFYEHAGFKYVGAKSVGRYNLALYEKGL